MDGQVRRRIWQLHLSTAVLMMLAAGVAMWFAWGRFIAPFMPTQSAWVESEGLAARILVENSIVNPGSDKLFRLELKNTSGKAYRVAKEAKAWEDITIRPMEGTHYGTIGAFCFYPKEPRFSDYAVLQPGEALQHELRVEVSKQAELTTGNYVYEILGHDILARAEFSNGSYKPIARLYENDSPDQNKEAIPVWPGSITTAPIPLTIDLPWSPSRIATVIAYVIGALVLTAVVFEFFIRRIEARKQAAPANVAS